MHIFSRLSLIIKYQLPARFLEILVSTFKKKSTCETNNSNLFNKLYIAVEIYASGLNAFLFINQYNTSLLEIKVRLLRGATNREASS